MVSLSSPFSDGYMLSFILTVSRQLIWQNLHNRHQPLTTQESTGAWGGLPQRRAL
jgi:hypothetical protein